MPQKWFLTSTDPEARYLAHLFHGAIAERNRTFVEAIHDYDKRGVKTSIRRPRAWR